MKTITSLPAGMVTAHPPILTVGMFDGVHLGHQAVIEEMVRLGNEISAPTVILTFDRHPRSIVNPTCVPRMITSLDHRLAIFAEKKIGTTIVLPFSRELAEMDGRGFIEEIAVKGLRTRHIVLGHDTHFGKDRSGNIGLLEEMAVKGGFSVTDIPPLLQGGKAISSTRVREAVLAGEFGLAQEMLGRPVSVMGTVISGHGKGRDFGFPTLNLDLHHELHPPEGVYFTRTKVGNKFHPSATFIGRRPAPGALDRHDVVIESHVLTGDTGSIYGQAVTVEFLKFHREIGTFISTEDLIAAIHRDTETSRAFHSI